MISDNTRLEAFAIVVHRLRSRIDKLTEERDEARDALASVRADRDRYWECCYYYRVRSKRP